MVNKVLVDVRDKQADKTVLISKANRKVKKISSVIFKMFYTFCVLSTSKMIIAGPGIDAFGTDKTALSGSNYDEKVVDSRFGIISALYNGSVTAGDDITVNYQYTSGPAYNPAIDAAIYVGWDSSAVFGDNLKVNSLCQASSCRPIQTV